MKKSCRSCEFLVHYGGNEYDCSKEGDCPIRNSDIERPRIPQLLRDNREPFSRYKIPKK